MIGRRPAISDGEELGGGVEDDALIAAELVGGFGLDGLPGP
jgi:hypothetical protein